MRKILIIKLSALGDVFLALPHIDSIIEHHCNDLIWLMTSPPYVQVFEHHPRLQVVSLNRGHRVLGESRLARILWTRNQRFDTIYDLQGNRTSRLLVRFSRASKLAGIKPSKIYTHHPALPAEGNPNQSFFAHLNKSLISFGLQEAQPNSVLHYDPQDEEMVDGWKRRYSVPDYGYVLLHAGSSRDWPTKRWPEESFATIAQCFTDSGIQCIWVGSTEDEAVNKRLAAKTGIDATGAFSLLQLYILGLKAQFAVANDSGPMHIMAAAGIPVFSFFGPTSWVRSHAVGQQARVMSVSLPCSPCFKKACPVDKKHACMTTLRPKDVITKISSNLGVTFNGYTTRK